MYIYGHFLQLIFMKTEAKILVIDDDKDVLLAAKLFLNQYFTSVHTETNPEHLPDLMHTENYDIILLDMNFSRDSTSGQEGFYWLNRALEIDPSAVIIFITGYGDIELAVQGIKEGATNFILKPWDNQKLLAEIAANLQVRESKKELAVLRDTQKQLMSDMDSPFVEIIGHSHAMERVLNTVKKVAQTEANVLLLGENGTGKELIARAIHRISDRNNEVFISVDLGAITESLFESELFGYKKGAFTDAKEDRAGRFEAANGGTIFLDEIGNLSYSLQSKLLSILQNRKVVRLGTHVEIPIDVRVICATNMSLYEMVEEGKFRQDLLYRVNTVEIQTPPLRDRLDDIPDLVEHFLGVYIKKYRLQKKKVSVAAIKRLKKHNWPGNIRELQHSVERAVIMSEESSLQAHDFFLTKPIQKDALLNAENLNLGETERILIRKVIDKHGGNISKAAKELGLTRASLYRRIEKHDL